MFVLYIILVAAIMVVFVQLFDRDYGLLNWVLYLVGAGSIDFA